MKDKIILAIIVVFLSLFGLRSFLPQIPSSALVALFIIAGIIICFYYLKQSRDKRRKI